MGFVGIVFWYLQDSLQNMFWLLSHFLISIHYLCIKINKTITTFCTVFTPIIWNFVLIRNLSKNEMDPYRICNFAVHCHVVWRHTLYYIWTGHSTIHGKKRQLELIYILGWSLYAIKNLFAILKSFTPLSCFFQTKYSWKKFTEKYFYFSR